MASSLPSTDAVNFFVVLSKKPIVPGLAAAAAPSGATADWQKYRPHELCFRL
jgi:hypothetical protein